MEKRKIILVDDEKLVLNSLVRTLRREGYELLPFTRAEDALKYLETDYVDVIISDHRMPSITGIEFLIKARKKYPDIIRILLTGYSDMDVAIKAVNEGKLFRFLSKPWNDEELKLTLVNALQLRNLLQRNKELLEQIKNQESYIEALEIKYPGISEIKRDASGAVLINEA